MSNFPFRSDWLPYNEHTLERILTNYVILNSFVLVVL